jgi:CubicO group peptidase (beta-lactamase class C family)
MTFRPRHLAVLLLAVAIGVPPAVFADDLPRSAPEQVGLSSERLSRISEAFHAYVKEGKLAGVVAIVARRGKVAYFEAFGQRDRESSSPMAKDSMFRIASQTKAIVSVAAMILQEEGRLLISDPVGKYIPEFMKTTVAIPKDGGGYDVVPARRPITIRDLLTHTAGISYGSGPARDQWTKATMTGWYFADREEPIATTIARMASLPFDAQPGERWIYGYSTDILGVVVEKASGTPLDEVLRSRILEPLAMRDTHFYVPPAKKNRLATVYGAGPGGALRRAPDSGGMQGQGLYADGPRRSFSGGAGLVSTANDYARFLQMLLNGGTLDGKRILSRKTVELMTVSHLEGKPFRAGESFGLGFSVLEDVGARGSLGTVGEYGWGGAYHSTYWVDPKEHLVVVYLTQLIPAGNLDDQGKLRTLVYQAIVD